MTSTSSAISLSPKYYRCRLGRRQLDGLFGTASAGFSSGSIEFSTERSSRTFVAATLDDLVRAVREAPLPGDPDQWDNLTFTGKDPSGKCAVTIRISPDRVHVLVTGTDPTWVYGADAQIRMFLEDEAIGGSGTRNSGARRGIARALMGVLFWTFLIVYAVVWYPDSPRVAPTVGEYDGVNEPLPPTSLAVLAFIALYFAVKTVRLSLRWRASRGRLSTTGELPSGTWWKRLSAAEQLSAAALLVAIFAALGTLVSAGADVFKG